MKIDFKCGKNELIDYYLYFWYRGFAKCIIIAATICGVLSVFPIAYGIYTCTHFSESGKITLGFSCLLAGIVLLSFALIVAFCYRPSFIRSRCLKAMGDNSERLALLSADFFVVVQDSTISYISIEKGLVTRPLSDLSSHKFSKYNLILFFSDSSSSFIPKSAFKENQLSEFLSLISH